MICPTEAGARWLGSLSAVGFGRYVVATSWCVSGFHNSPVDGKMMENDGKWWKTREKMTCLTEKICERNLRRLMLKCHAAIHHFRIDETRWLKDSRDKLKSNQWTNMNKRQISRKSLKAHSKRQQNKKLDLSRLFQWSCCLYPHLALWSVLPQRNTQKEQIRLEEFRNSKKSKNSDRQFIETFNAVLNESLDWMIQLRW